MQRSIDLFNHHFSALKILSQRKTHESINVHLHALLIGYILLSLLINVCYNMSAVLDAEEQHRQAFLAINIWGQTNAKLSCLKVGSVVHTSRPVE